MKRSPMFLSLVLIVSFSFGQTKDTLDYTKTQINANLAKAAVCAPAANPTLTGTVTLGDSAYAPKLKVGVLSGAESATDSLYTRVIIASVVNAAGFTGSTIPTVIGITLSDEATALLASTTVPKITFRMPYAMTVTALRASAVICPTSDSIIVDIHETGTSIMTNTKLHIDATEYTSTTAGVGYVLTDAALANDALIEVFCDRVGSAVAGTGLKVWIIGTRIAP